METKLARWSRSVAASLLTLAAVAPRAAAQFEHLVARIEGAQALPPTASTTLGSAAFALDPWSGTVRYQVTLGPLGSAETSARIRALPTSPGPVQTIATLSLGASKIGSYSLLSAQVADLLAGNHWIEIATAQHPAGELRGAIVRNDPALEPGAAHCSGDGSSAPTCPCGNVGAPGNGCASSFDPAGARLSATGDSAVGSTMLHVTGVPSGATVLFVGGTNASAPIVFGDGLRCFDPVTSLKAVAVAGGQATLPDVLHPQPLQVFLGVTPGSGELWYYTAVYRNPAAAFCPPSSFNATNGYLTLW